MERPFSSKATRRAALCTLAAVLAISGCGSDRALLDADAITVARDEKYSTTQRVEAVQRAWNDAAAGKTNKAAVRADMKDIAWTTTMPVQVRLAALNAVFADTDPAILEDSRNMTRLMLPREPSAPITARLCEEALKWHWADCTPSLVRSLSRWHEGTPDDQREEYKTIALLNPNEKVEVLVYNVFLNPPPAKQLAFVTPERVQADAWDLLRRLDKDGSIRGSLVLGLEKGESTDTTPGVTIMRRAMRELRVVPLTGDEYLWLLALGNSSDKARSEWWASTSAIVQKLDDTRAAHLQMRHLEAIRWTSGAHADRLAMDRAALLDELRARLKSRRVHTRTVREREIHRAPPERLADWESKLSWGDLIAILAVDEAIRDPNVVASLFAQRNLDRNDEQAEYGGLLRSNDAGSGFAAVLYPPRQGERRGDKEFVASPDMMQQGDLALAHYHFHAQQMRNADYAGPSYKDFAYASRFGRTCLVFTSLSEESIDADLYQPDGVVIDLGDLSEKH